MAICENIATLCAWRLLTICCDMDTFFLFVEAYHSWRSFFLLIVRCFLVRGFQLVGGVEMLTSTMMRMFNLATS